MERDDNGGFVTNNNTNTYATTNNTPPHQQQQHQVHKVETAGDCYIVSCGIMERDDNDAFVKVSTEHDHSRSAAKVLDFAKGMLKISKLVNMPHNNKPATIRIGMHTGSVVSGVIGTKLPKFSVFGDTMNTASRMESTANHGGIQVSDDTYSLLQSAGNTDTWEGTGGIEVKGKGIMETFHLQMDEDDFDVNAIKIAYKEAARRPHPPDRTRLRQHSPDRHQLCRPPPPTAPAAGHTTPAAPAAASRHPDRKVAAHTTPGRHQAPPAPPDRTSRSPAQTPRPIQAALSRTNPTATAAV
eukprot:gene18583-25094_t